MKMHRLILTTIIISFLFFSGSCLQALERNDQRPVFRAAPEIRLKHLELDVICPGNINKKDCSPQARTFYRVGIADDQGNIRGHFIPLDAYLPILGSNGLRAPCNPDCILNFNLDKRPPYVDENQVFYKYYNHKTGQILLAPKDAPPFSISDLPGPSAYPTRESPLDFEEEIEIENEDTANPLPGDNTGIPDNSFWNKNRLISAAFGCSSFFAANTLYDYFLQKRVEGLTDLFLKTKTSIKSGTVAHRRWVKGISITVRMLLNMGAATLGYNVTSWVINKKDTKEA